MKIQLAIALMAATVAANAQTARSAQVIRTERPWLGIGVKDITDADSARKMNLKDPRGVEITNVEENSPAAKAGIKEGDVILEYNGQPVEGGEQLSRLVRETPIGRQVKLGVWRSGGMQNLSATIEPNKSNRQVIIANGGTPFAMGDMPVMPTMPDMRNFHIPEIENLPGMVTIYSSPTIGIVGEPLANQDQFADFLGVKDGVLVKQVHKNSAAEKAGLKAGDVIVKVEDTQVSASRDITRALREAKGKKTVTVTIVRNKKEMPLTVTLDTPSIGSPVRARARAMVFSGVRV
jgi:serine protease Do